MGFNFKKAAGNVAQGAGKVASAGTYQGGNVFKGSSYTTDPKKMAQNIGGGIIQTGGLGLIDDPFNKNMVNPAAPPEGPQTDYSSLIQKSKEELAKQQQKAKEQEDLLKGQMISASQEQASAIDRQLADLINQTGFVSGLQKQQIGESMAGQGVLRSGQTALRLGSQELARQKQVGGLQSQAEGQKRTVEQQVTQAQQQIAQRRQGIENQMKLAELGAYTNLQQSQDLQKIQNEFSTYLNDLNLAGQKKQDFMSIFSSLGGAVGIGAGYNSSNLFPSSTPAPTAAPGTGSQQLPTTQVGSYQPAQQLGVARV